MRLILTYTVFFLLALGNTLSAQDELPKNFTVKNDPGDFDAIYTAEGSEEEKVFFYIARRYFLPLNKTMEILSAPDSTGNAVRGEFQVVAGTGEIYYIDGAGRALKIYEPAAAGTKVYQIASLADTTTITSPIEGDVAYVDSTEFAFRDSLAWLPFKGGSPDSTIFATIYYVDSLHAAQQAEIDSVELVVDTLQSDLSDLEGQVDTLPTGSGGIDTIPMWVTASRLGNSFLSQNATTVIAGGTGAFRPPIGTDAQAPTGVLADMRWTTTQGRLSIYNGSARKYFAYLDDIPNIWTDYGTTIRPTNNEKVLLGGISDQGSYDLQVDAGVYVNSGNIVVNGSSNGVVVSQAGRGIVFGDNNNHIDLSDGMEFQDYTGRFTWKASPGVGGAQFMEINGPSLEVRVSLLAGMTSGNTVISGWNGHAGSAGGNLFVQGGRGLSSNVGTGGNLYLRGGDAKQGATTDTPGYIYLQTQNEGSSTYNTGIFIQENGARVSIGGSHSPTTDLDIAGGVRMRDISESSDSLTNKVSMLDSDGDVVFRYEKVGTATATTDGTGRLTIAHGLGVAPNWAIAQAIGNDRIVVNALPDLFSGTNIVFHISQDDASLNNTEVTVFYLAKKY